MSESPMQLVTETGRQLGRVSRPNKDFLVKSLRQAASALSQIEQQGGDKAIESALMPFNESIIKRGLLRHSDKDVKLLVAICVSEVLRVLAPSQPFDDKHMRDVFKLIINLFEDLADTSSPYFSKRVKILDTVARCKCYVLMLDIDCDDLVLQMFDVFFSVVRDNHQKSMINDILSIITHLLNEEAKEPLLDIILRNLVKDEKAGSAKTELALSVIQNCEKKLSPPICSFLTSCFLDKEAVESDLKETYHEILLMIFRCAPRMLLNVIPCLMQELKTDQVDIRIKAVNLLGKLFAVPEQHVAQKYLKLFVEFINRFTDKSVEVRLAALQCAKAFYLSNPLAKELGDVLNALEGRFLDFEDKIRTQAVVVACDLARSNLKCFPPELISKAAERLWDKKISVRKKALQKLVEVYQHYCSNCSEGYMHISDHFEEIPRKVLILCFDKDCKEFRCQNLELILAEDLFPTSLSVGERMKHWIHIFSTSTPLQAKALNLVLLQKRRFRAELQIYLGLRKKGKENSEEMVNRIRHSFTRMSALFPDPSKAETCFHKLNEMKDNHVFDALEQLLDDEANLVYSRDKFLKMMGDKHPHVEFLELLSSKCSFNIFNSEHVRFILNQLSGSGSGNHHSVSSCVHLLLSIIRIFPTFLRGSEPQLQQLIGEDSVDCWLIEVLAKAGPHISVNFRDFYPFLKRMCLEGTGVQSKHAVYAIAALAGSSEKLIFSKICKELVDLLQSGTNTATVLQSLGCIAQHNSSAFDDYYGEITSHILQMIFQVEQCNDTTSNNDTPECSEISKLKIYGLKTLVKSFLPHRGIHISRPIDELAQVLWAILKKNDACDESNSSTSDDPHMRLAAAKSVLRISRRWDLHISPEIFRLTILMAKDSNFFVRRAFLDKTQKLLREHSIPNKYACAFALAMSDCSKDLQDASSNYIEVFIKDYNKEAQTRQVSAVQGGSITDHPVYTLVYLIHVLAHDDSFPSEVCGEELFAHFCSPLLFAIQALVNTHILNGDLDLNVDAVSKLICIFRAIKRAEDAVDASRTPKIQFLAEIGISVIKLLNHGGVYAARPEQILLPSLLYKISSKLDEADLRSQPGFLDESFVNKVVHILKSQISSPASGLPKRGRKCKEDGLQSADTKQSILNPAYHQQREQSTAWCAETTATAHQSMSLEGRRKRALSPNSLGSGGMHNEHSGISNLCGNSKPFEESEQPSSCDSATMKSWTELPSSCHSATVKSSRTELQVTVPSVQRTSFSLKVNGRASNDVVSESSKHSTLVPKGSNNLREIIHKSEAPTGKRIKLLTPVGRCFKSGTVMEYNSQSNVHKTSHDSGGVELLCLDSESWETIDDGSLAEKEIMQPKSNSLQSRHPVPLGCSSRNNLKETVSSFGKIHTRRSKHVANKENRRIS